MAADGNSAPELDSDAHDDLESIELLDPGARIDAALERDLRWFLGDPVIAGLVADSGGFGGQLERAESYGYGAIPCRKCGGTWRQRRRSSDGELRFSEWRDGTGWVPSPRFFPKVASTYVRALALFRERQVKELGLLVIGRGGAETVNEEAALLYGELMPGRRMVSRAQLEAMFPELPPELCRPCTACQGIGVVPRRTHKRLEVTARPTGSSVGKAGRSPDSMATVAWEDLHRYRRVDRVLEHVAGVRPLHRLALATYYAPAEITLGRDGASLGAHGFEGLWPFSPTARAWLDVAGIRRPLEGELAAIRKRADSGDSAAWLKAVRREAWGLYGAACANANAAARATGWVAA